LGDASGSNRSDGATCSISPTWRWASRSWRCSASTPRPSGDSEMAELIVWGFGALVIAGYMVVALLRPEKF